MEKFLSSKLPNSISSNVYKNIKSLNLSHSIARQKIRMFCNRYKYYPQAIEQYSIQELINDPKLWEISTTQDIQRQQWLKESYPKFKENNTENTKRSLLKCGKCGKHKVKINAQIQIRGADEPMTIFAECLNCGKHWTQS